MARLNLSTPRDVRLLDRGMSIGEALAAFNASYPDAGGTASFIGKVRSDDDVKALELTHYEPLTLPGMEELAQAASEKFGLAGEVVTDTTLHASRRGPRMRYSAPSSVSRLSMNAAASCAISVHLPNCRRSSIAGRSSNSWSRIFPTGKSMSERASA